MCTFLIGWFPRCFQCYIIWPCFCRCVPFHVKQHNNLHSAFLSPKSCIPIAPVLREIPELTDRSFTRNQYLKHPTAVGGRTRRITLQANVKGTLVNSLHLAGTVSVFLSFVIIVLFIRFFSLKQSVPPKIRTLFCSVWLKKGVLFKKFNKNKKIKINHKEKDTILTLCQWEYTQFFWVRFEMCLKEKSFNCTRFSINPTLFFSEHDGKTITNENFDFIYWKQNSLCINADWTNLSLHLKLL